MSQKVDLRKGERRQGERRKIKGGKRPYGLPDRRTRGDRRRWPDRRKKA
jgi:hypothetical protein